MATNQFEVEKIVDKRRRGNKVRNYEHLTEANIVRIKITLLKCNSVLIFFSRWNIC